jgi:hypothetical protein
MMFIELPFVVLLVGPRPHGLGFENKIKTITPLNK